MPLLKTLEAFSFRLFGGIAPKFLKNVYQFKNTLNKARIKIYPETYVSLMLFIALLTVPVSVISIVILAFFGFMPIIFLIPLPLYVMAGFLLAPMSKASDRGANLEREMPFVASYISVMASGGIAPYTSFKRLSDVDLMPAMKSESREIIKDVEIFGIDPLSALEKAAKENPLDIFKEFLAGYASTVIIGGDIGHFLERKAEDIFKERASRVKAAAERLGMLMETFIIVQVMMSLCFYILFSVNAIQPGATQDISGMIMYTYLFTPLLSGMFIWLAHNMQPKSPVTEMRPYKVFGISAVAAVIVFLVLTNFMGLTAIPLITSLQTVIDLPFALSIALVISTAPAAVVAMKLQSHKDSMEAGINNFLRDLTEVRKTGLSPERCIESLSNKDYGSFSKELRKISSEISWGIPIKKVIMDFLKRTKSWMVQLNMFLLVETIDVGGGTISMIESLARFNNLTQETEKEKKMSVRPYVFMPYLASLLLVATTVMMLSFTSGTLLVGVTGSQPTQDLSQVRLIFMASVIFNSYLIGIVAGKISSESVASGFKHATILVIISLIAAKLVPLFINL
ncbi:MAG: type II secretion system F family protein [Candidatus Bathyarchaeia archaeon]